MYLYRLLYVLSGLLLILGILLALPGVEQAAVAILTTSLKGELREISLLAPFGGALGALLIARALHLLVDIREQLYRVEDELSDFDEYPM